MKVLFRNMAAIGVLGALCLNDVGQSEAASLCSEPLKPICIGEDATYEDDAATVRCEQDLKQYALDLKEYTLCLERTITESRAMAKQARAEFDRRKGE